MSREHEGDQTEAQRLYKIEQDMATERDHFGYDISDEAIRRLARERFGESPMESYTRWIGRQSEIEDQYQDRPAQHESLSHSAPRIVTLGLAPDDFEEELSRVAHEHLGNTSIAFDVGRSVRTVEGVFFGRESAFEPEPDRLTKFLGRLGILRQEPEEESIPVGVIVFPTIKAKGGDPIDSPIEAITALCAEHGVPIVAVAPDLSEAPTAEQLLQQLFPK